MNISKLPRDFLIRILKRDIIEFLSENEEKIIKAVGLELEKVDRRIPEEDLFIDIKMEELGQELTRAILDALKRFLRDY